MERVLPVVLLVCLLALAGCSGFSAGGSGSGSGAGPGIGNDAGSRVSVTPAPVPTVERTGTSGPRLAPGLAADGVADPDALLAAHRSVLDDTTYTVRAVVNATYPNGTTYYRTAARARVTERDDGYHYSSRFDRPNRSTNTLVRYESWSGGGTILTAATRRENATEDATIGRSGNTTTDRNATYSQDRTYRAIRSEYERNTGLYGLPRYGERITAQVGAAETVVRERADTVGSDPYILAIGSVRDLRALADGRFRDPRNATGRLLVDPQGFVREYRLRYTATTPEGYTVRVAESISYSAVGRTAVKRPPWYEKALNATNVTVEETQ
jgi:hypothetical protein